MTLLRLLLHSLAAALVSLPGVVLFLLALNPRFSVTARHLAGMLLGLSPLLALFVLVWPVLLMTAQVFAVGRIGIPPVSLKYFRRFLALDLSLLLFSLVFNRYALAGVLDQGGAERLRWLSNLLASALLVLGGSLLAERRLRRQEAPASSLVGLRLGVGVVFLLAFLLAAAVVLPRDPPPDDRPPVRRGVMRGEGEIVLLGIDGLGPEPLLDHIEEGRLPNFGRLLREGAHGILEGRSPGIPASLWTSFGTGRSASGHGIADAWAYHLPLAREGLRVLPRGILMRRLVDADFLSRRPVPPESRRASSFEEIFPRYDLAVGTVGWWLAGEPGPGGYRVETAFLEGEQDQPGVLLPPSLADVAAGWVLHPEEIDPAEVTAFFDPPMAELPDLGRRREVLAGALALDRSARRVAHALSEVRPVHVTAIALRGYDRVAHLFLGEAPRSTAPFVRDEAVRTAGRVADRYLRELDRAVGEEMSRAGPETLLVLVSPFGMTESNLRRRLHDKLTGEPYRTAHHDSPEDGVLFLWGRGVAPGRDLGHLAIESVLPALLWASGLPLDPGLAGTSRVFAAFSDEFARRHRRVSVAPQR